MARRLCRLPRLLPLAAAPKPQPHHRLPIPAARVPSFSSPTPPPPPPSFPTFPRLFSTSSSAGTPPFPSPISSLRGSWTAADHFPASPAGDPSMVVVGSADSFATIHSKVQDEKLPAVFYYTAVWCGPCRAMAPVIEKLSRQYPKIPVYKVDIDMDGIGTRLGNLKIFSVPTFHLYHKGEKTSEVVGADTKKLEAAMESLHKQQ
ncbi:unnamed protein product [Alopecurus aequalis]